MTFSRLTHLECTKCAAKMDAHVPQGTCACGGVLFARYDLAAAARDLDRDDIARRPANLWRYHELLPVSVPESIVSLGEGMTPLVPVPRLGTQLRLPRLSMKDESALPTGTFKSRGAAVGVSRAKELGVTAIAMPTNGNAGAAWAAYGARAGLACCIVMPEDAPEITRRECSAFGAELHVVRGLIGDAGRVVAQRVASDGFFDASTLKEPYRLEGKKTMGYEIVEQLGWRVPDVIIYPTGGGVGIIGIYKALREMQQLGWIAPTLPRLVAVQAEGCAPIVRAFDEGRPAGEPWPDAHTVAFGITVPKALGDYLVLDAVRETGGCALSVRDEDLLAATADVARLEGAFICPEGGATVAAARVLRDRGWLSEDDEVVLLNTGAGLKYPQVAPEQVASWI